MVNSLEETMSQINKKFGADTIKYGLTKEEPKRTGSIYFDYLLGGGIEYGTISTFYGDKHSGKTTASLRIIAEAQKRGEKCAFLRVEKGCNYDYMKKLGVDLDKLIILENLYGEAFLDAANSLVESGIDVLVIDSISALVPKAVLEADVEKCKPGIHARMCSTGIMKLNNLNRKTLIICISQVRNKINLMGPAGKSIAGGKSLEFYSDYMIEFRLKGNLDDDMKEINKELKKENKPEITGATMLLHVAKNRRGIPKRSGEMYLSFKTGKVDEIGEIMTVSKKLNLILVSGGWIKHNGESLRPKDFRLMVLKDNEFKNQLIDSIYKKLGGYDIEDNEVLE